MNHYKQAWMSNVGIIHDNSRGEAQHQTDSMFEKTVDAFIDHQKEAATAAIVMGFLGHMAESQFTGTPGVAFRTIGRIGIRAVPIIGAAALAYSVYKFFDD